MSTVRSFRDLTVWQLVMQLAKDVYQATESLPNREIYGLTSQLRRCAVSIPSNIAEGHARESSKEYLHHVYLSQERVTNLLASADDLGRRLRGLQKSMRAKVE